MCFINRSFIIFISCALDVGISAQPRISLIRATVTKYAVKTKTRFVLRLSLIKTSKCIFTHRDIFIVYYNFFSN